MKKTDTTPFEIPGGTTGRLYPNHPAGEHTLAVVEMDGIYPLKGSSRNSVCTETMYVMEGTLNLTVDGEVHVLEEGDCYAITPGHAYRCEGKVKVLDVITPAWDKAQNEIIEE